MNICRLTANDYDEWLQVLNDVFGRTKPNGMQFEKELPKMCIRDDYHVGMHLAIRDEGKIRAIVGIYPLPAIVGGIPVMFSTVGNVATHWDYEGRGYMAALMDRAMKELEVIGADASRLGGLRQRYNRFGYESCGTQYRFSITERNINKCLPDFRSDIEFVEILKDDTERIAEAARLYASGGIAVDRSRGEDFYLSTIAWQNKPWAALRPDGTMAGYISALPDSGTIAEIGADTPDLMLEIICQWQRKVSNTISLKLAPWQPDFVRKFASICEKSEISSPCNFMIRSWQKVADALIKLKSTYSALPDGELILGIKDYGTIRLYVSHNEAGCELTSKTPSFTLDRLTAARYLFGPMPPIYAYPYDCPWLPLPLSWNLQDRV